MSSKSNKVIATKKKTIRTINPLRADVYGVNYQRNMTVKVDADLADRAIKNQDAKLA